jgi:hypothetical protein
MKESQEGRPGPDSGKEREPEVPASVLAELMRNKSGERHEVKLGSEQNPEEYAKGIAEALERAKKNPPKI